MNVKLVEEGVYFPLPSFSPREQQENLIKITRGKSGQGEKPGRKYYFVHSEGFYFLHILGHVSAHISY